MCNKGPNTVDHIIDLEKIMHSENLRDTIIKTFYDSRRINKTALIIGPTNARKILIDTKGYVIHVWGRVRGKYKSSTVHIT